MVDDAECAENNKFDFDVNDSMVPQNEDMLGLQLLSDDDGAHLNVHNDDGSLSVISSESVGIEPKQSLIGKCIHWLTVPLQLLFKITCPPAGEGVFCSLFHSMSIPVPNRRSLRGSVRSDVRRLGGSCGGVFVHPLVGDRSVGDRVGNAPGSVRNAIDCDRGRDTGYD